MKNRLLFAFFLSITLSKGYCQADSANLQFGLSGLPVYDVLKIFPENKIQGVALTGNLGYFPAKSLIFGVLVYYAQVSNSYPVLVSDRETQDSRFYGLNTYLRHYFKNKKKCRLFSLASAGFGNSQHRLISSKSLALTRYSNELTLALQLGVGINYLVTKKMAVEFTIPYTYLKYLTSGATAVKFQTIMPGLGIQFFLK